MPKNDKIYINHIKECIATILDYTKGMNEEHFLRNKLVQDAVIRNFEVIGEATKNISENLKSENQQIPWRKMAGMRDKLIHDYIGVDLFSVWLVVEKILPELKEQLENINVK